MKTLLRLNTKQFEGKSRREITDFAISFYQHRIQGLSIRNEDIGVEIEFNRIGRKKSAQPLMGPIKAAAIIHLPYLLKNAHYNNWGKLKRKHKIKHPTSIGFMNFKVAVKVDGKIQSFRISVLMRSENKFQYDFHEDSISYGRKKKQASG